jgi:Arc/MetJ family transcription regulator
VRKEYDFKGAKRGAIVRPPPGKTRITIRLDDDVLEWFRNRTDSAGGGSYQTMINAALRTLMQEGQANIEPLLRRVLREELKRSKGSSMVARRPHNHALQRPALARRS